MYIDKNNRYWNKLFWVNLFKISKIQPYPEVENPEISKNSKINFFEFYF